MFTRTGVRRLMRIPQTIKYKYERQNINADHKLQNSKHKMHSEKQIQNEVYLAAQPDTCITNPLFSGVSSLLLSLAVAGQLNFLSGEVMVRTLRFLWGFLVVIAHFLYLLRPVRPSLGHRPAILDSCSG